MKRTVFACLVIMLLVASASLAFLPRSGISEDVEDFNGDQQTSTVTFTAAGSDDTVKIRLDTKDRVKSASFNISNGNYLGEYLRTPAIDIGNDGDQDWSYSEAGYGSWGDVDQFSNGAQRVDFNLKAGSTLAYVTLPEGAQVTSAHLSAKGIFDATYQKNVAALDGVDACWSLDHADLDGDGFEDVVGVENIDSGELFWYENPQSMSGAWTYHTIDTLDYGYQVRCTDMDGDSDTDVILSIRATAGGIKWYENVNGDGSAWTDHNINMTFTWAGMFDLADINGNGSEDIVLLADTYNMGRLAWLEKPTDLGQNWTTYVINNTITYMAYLKVADLDGDTHPDIVMSRDYWDNTGGLFLFECPDDPVNESWTGYRMARFGGPYEVTVSDLDGDLDPDIIVANASYSRVTWYEAPASTFTGAWVPHDMATGISGVSSVSLADMDGDLDLDVVASSQWGDRGYWLEHPSSGVTNPWTVHQVGSGIYDSRLAIPVDLDKANQLDMVVYGYDFGQVCALVENTGVYQQYDIQELSTGQPTMMVTGNFDNENASDIAFISYNGESLCIRRSTADPTDIWTLDVVDTSLNTPYGLNATDLDSDGDLDLLVCCYGGNDLYWYENRYNSTPSNPWLRHTIKENVPEGEYRFLRTANIDGKNATDLLVYERWTDGANHANNCLVWFEAPLDPTDAGQPWRRHVIASGLRGVLGFDVADLDQDGYLDVAFTQYRSTGGYFGNVSWARHPTGYSNAKQPWEVRLISIDHEYPLDIECFDVDANGVEDIVVSDYLRDSMKWYGTPDDPTSPTVTWNSYYIDYNIPYAQYIDCYDVGGDGNPDIVATDVYADRVVWYTNSKDPGVTIDWKARDLDSQAKWAYDVCFGDFSGDGLVDVGCVGQYPARVYWYDLQPLYSPAAYLDVGYDTTVDWTITDLANTTKSPDLKDVFNSAASKVTAETDTNGNRIVKVPMMLTGPERNASLLGVDITYDTTLTLAGAKIVSELNDYLAANNATPAVDVPIRVTATSAGKITFSDLKIDLNDAPTLLTDIPDNLSVNEDSKNDILLDLRDHYSDDFTEVNALVYAVESFTDQDHVNVQIYSDYFLSVDATLVENWYGKTQVTVSATDADGFTTLSNAFNVTIASVNDKPLAGPDDFSSIVMDEGGSYSLNLSAKQYFLDPDGDKLYYSTDIHNQNPSIRENLSVVFDPVANTLEFSARDDWTINDLLLEVYCDDQENVSTALSKNLKLDVTNILEPLAWSQVPIVNIKEDSENPGILDLTGYVSDPDHPKAPVSFLLVSYENESYLDVDLNPGGRLDITAHSNFHGDSLLKVRAENAFGTATTTIYVIVESVNDPPAVSDLSPADELVTSSDTLQISWTAVDVEGDPLMFYITLEQVGGATRNFNTTNQMYTFTGLLDNTTYYWQVTVSDGTDTVELEKRMFRVSFALVDEYKLEIVCDTSVTVAPGEWKNFAITVRNPSSVQNNVVAWIEEVSPEELSTFVTMPLEFSTVYLDPGQEKTLTLKVDLEEFDGETGDYVVTLQFQNGNTKRIEERVITVKVREDGGGGGLNACYILIPIFIVLLIIIVIVAVIIVRKRKQDDSDLYDFKRVPAEPGEEQAGAPMEEEGLETDEPALPQDIEDELSKILESAGVEEGVEGPEQEDGVLEPEIEDSSPFDEEEGPVDLEEALKEMPAMDITPDGAQAPAAEPSRDAGVQQEAVGPSPVPEGPQKAKVKTRYSYTYSKKKSKHTKQDDDVVELKPIEDDDDEPPKKPRKGSKRSGK